MCVLERYRSVDANGAPCKTVRTFTPFDALWKAYLGWLEAGGAAAAGLHGPATVYTSNCFGRLLTPIVGVSKAQLCNQNLEPSGTLSLWDPRCLANPQKQSKGRFGIRFKTALERQ